ncbi:MAG: right-handed parallel beta-helix repeat-containing protein [Lachnospiraceae bacterium]|nr:right-handed parallel beta-helix repeat-containing protein [Lachnospiraceae bacterium]
MRKRVLKNCVVLMSVCICFLAVTYVKTYAATSQEPYTMLYVQEPTLAGINETLRVARDRATDAHPCKVVVPRGVYRFKSSIIVYSNTYLELEGVTLVRTDDSKAQLIHIGDNGNQTSGVLGYYYKNITVHGGVLDGNTISHTVLKAAHAKNVTFSNMTVRNIKDAHLCEVAAVDGLTFDHCAFADQVITKDASRYEAIQLDVLVSYHMNTYRCEPLPLKNVKVTNCEFRNVPRGVGSHTAIFNAPIENIQITGNNFVNCNSAAIQALDWKNATITNNTISSCPRGIIFYAMREKGYGTVMPAVMAAQGNTTTTISSGYKTPASNMNIVIANNKVNCSGDDPNATTEKNAILISGTDIKKNAPELYDGSGGVPKGNYYISGVTIKNNVIKGTGTVNGIKCVNSRNVTASGNQIQINGKASKYGINFTIGCKNVSAVKNVITNIGLVGVYLYDNASAKNITGNRITNPGKYGIGIDTKSSVTTLSKNTITKPKLNGIYFVRSSKAKKISGNTIAKPGKYGIGLDLKSDVTKIEKNKITGAKMNGIFVVANAKAGSIQSNTIKNSGNYGIGIAVGASVTKIIKGNKISKTKNHGIAVVSNAKVKKIKGNKISGVPKKSLKLYVSRGCKVNGKKY